MSVLEIASDAEWEDFLSNKIHGGIPKRIKNRVEQESAANKLPFNISFQEKIFMLRNNLKEIPKCENCESPVKFQISTTRYTRYCSYSCSAKSDSTQNKRRKTNIAKYGIQNIANLNKEERVKEFFEKRFDELESIKDKVVPLFSKEDWKGGLSSTKYEWRCNRCHTEYEAKLERGFPPCPKCERSFTDIEYVIKRILDELQINYQAHNRKILGHEKMEVDFYIPEYKVAIEVHGLWYHSENYFPAFYHQHKADVCLKKGIKLIQIFSDEILLKTDIVKSKILRALCISQNCTVIGARKCRVVQFTNNKKEIKSFLIQNHIQGNDNSSVKYAAYYGDAIVGVMTFCKPRIALGHKNAQENVWELSRFCTTRNFSCPGLFSKMLKHFIKEHKPLQIISYGDYRWTHPTDNVYCKAGFVYIQTSKPNYFYLKNGKRLHRFGFRKSALIKKYPELAHLTEKQIMQHLKIPRVWDAGHHKFSLICSYNKD